MSKRMSMNMNMNITLSKAVTRTRGEFFTKAAGWGSRRRRIGMPGIIIFREKRADSCRPENFIEHGGTDHLNNVLGGHLLKLERRSSRTTSVRAQWHQ